MSVMVIIEVLLKMVSVEWLSGHKVYILDIFCYH